jgi:D-glycero-beta-D-manno-heptose 1-phosphate adenylyltransferase
MSKSLESKIFSIQDLIVSTRHWSDSGLKIVFTNGCFDILHEGHVRYLAEAKNLGDKLIVAINSDHSVRTLKGPTRPINKETSRAVVLAGLQSVDAIVIFNEETPYELIKGIRPDVLVKGGDWNAESIVGSDIVLSNGGEVYSLSFHDGFSTSKIEQKIKTSS